MKFINVTVRNKIAQCSDATAFIVCSNSDYVINFDFDEEWDNHAFKTARFIFNGAFQDVVFEGNSVNVPIIYKSTVVSVGVSAGNLHTTTPAIIPCQKSILCDDGFIADPPPDVYSQIMNQLPKHEWDGTTLIMTSASGTSSADLKGEKGNLEFPVFSYDNSDGCLYVEGIDESNNFSFNITENGELEVSINE